MIIYVIFRWKGNLTRMGQENLLSKWRQEGDLQKYLGVYGSRMNVKKILFDSRKRLG